jgi:hypothetical protein
MATGTPTKTPACVAAGQANDNPRTLYKEIGSFMYRRCDQMNTNTKIKLSYAHQRGYRGGLLGGLLDAGIGGASCRSVGASSRVTVALRMAFRNRLPKLGTVLWWP